VRVLFFIEPVIFQGDPQFLAPHLRWAKRLEASVHTKGGSFAVTSNPEICSIWMNQQAHTELDRNCFVLDAFDPLGPFGYRRNLYAAALYGDGATDNPLKAALLDVRNSFRPDIVVLTSQNAFVRCALAGLPMLSIEQAPLPRLGQPDRLCFDPFGHQTNSLLEVNASTIKQLPLAENDLTALNLINQTLQAKVRRDPRYIAASLELDRIRENGRIALLATQPPDWITYDGSLQRIDVEGLLCAWAEQLPAGWIGVPTYHGAYRLNGRTEIALGRSRPRLRFLSSDLAQGISEVLLTIADGIVSISSTVSMSGLLFGKRVVAVGRCPFNGWCPRQVSEISSSTPLTPSEAACTLAFLTNRYSYVEEELESRPELFLSVANAAQTSSNVASWFFDFTDWSPVRTRSLFNLD
jgi:hypothetical protein